jgi:multidrug efflux pump subunit AcrA (membrane-fusion protein)
MILSRNAYIGVAATGLVAAVVAAFLLMRSLAHGPDPRLVTVERRSFVQVIRREGSLQPVNRHPILPKVNGTILKLAEDGATVEEGALILQLDATAYQEKLDSHHGRIRQLRANWDRDEKKALKEVRRAEDIVESQKLRLELERLRLKELELGPTETDELNKRVTLENARNLLDARKEELQILQVLASDGFVSKAEERQKKTEVEEQDIRVAQADVDYRKLHRPDPVKLGELRLKVQEAEKAVASSNEKVRMLKGDLERARGKLTDEMNEEQAEVKEHTKEIEQTRQLAPSPGIVLHGRGHWGQSIGAGREVHSGSEVMTVCDMRKMKAVVAIDEGRIGRIAAGQPANVRLIGRTQETCPARVTKTAEKGRDEFEDFNSATRDLTGKANRQVFDVEVELEDNQLNLRPGQRIEVEIEVCRMLEALVVPSTAVYREGADTAWVYVATNGGPERRSVEILAEDQHACVVKGLEMGERVWRVRP